MPEPLSHRRARLVRGCRPYCGTRRRRASRHLHTLPEPGRGDVITVTPDMVLAPEPVPYLNNLAQVEFAHFGANAWNRMRDLGPTLPPDQG